MTDSSFDNTVVKYRLYPFKSQELELFGVLETLREVHNELLERRINSWKWKHVSLNGASQRADLARWNVQDRRGVGRLYSHVVQAEADRMDLAYASFFRRVANGAKAGFPKFKREGELTSFTYPDGNVSAQIVDGRNGTKRLHLAKLGEIPVKVHRKLPNGKLGPVTVKREGSEWYVVLTYKVSAAPLPRGVPQTPIGADLGLKAVVALSDGTTVAPLQAYRHGQNRLRRAQKKLSRMVKGSENWKDQVKRVQKCHAKVRRQRSDFNHKLTTDLVSKHDLVAFENLNVSAMVRNGHLSKSISDVAWTQIVQQVEYKEKHRSGRCVKVDARGTTQDCSRCGGHPSIPLGLSVRIYHCEYCGMVEDRDVNAARNVLSRSYAIVGEGIPEVTPVERKQRGRARKSAIGSTSPKQEPPCAMVAPFEGPSGPSTEMR